MRYSFLGVCFAALLGVSCLDAPSLPVSNGQNPSFEVALVVNDSSRTALQAPPGSSFQLKVLVDPASVATRLRFSWFQQGDSAASGQTTPVLQAPQDMERQYWTLRVTDSEGNFVTQSFQLVWDNPPTLEDASHMLPALGDTLFNAPLETILFRWHSYDPDPYDTLTHFLDITPLNVPDSLLLSMNVGKASRVDYGALENGDYQYRLRVIDALGLADSTIWVPFFIRPTNAL